MPDPPVAVPGPASVSPAEPHPLDAHLSATGRVMLCAICSEPLNGAILNEDNKWVHPECEDNAEWNEEPL